MSWAFGIVGESDRFLGDNSEFRMSRMSQRALCSVVVELVDFGTQILAPRTKILPLLRRFGKAPPLCLKCRVDGLTINDLEIRDLHEFKNVISECNALFRVEIKSLEEPYVVSALY